MLLIKQLIQNNITLNMWACY